MRDLREIPENYKDLIWEDYEGIDPTDRKVMETVRKYSQHLKVAREMGMGLLLIGKVGTGKTGLIYLILRRLRELFIVSRVAYKKFAATNIEEMVGIYTQDWYSNEEGREFSESIQKADFLIIDDIGKEFRGKSGLTASVLDSVIRYRINWKLPTIMTSNISLKGLREIYGEALISVMLESVIILNFKGEDYRKKKVKKQVELFKEKIGVKRKEKVDARTTANQKTPGGKETKSGS